MKYISDITYNNTRKIGNIGESAALLEFTKYGIPVFFPFGQNTPIDLIILINHEFKKVQVKTTEKIIDGKIEFELCRTNGFTFKKTPYSKDDTDYFFLHCLENNSSYIIPFEEVSEIKNVTLRVDKPKNNQSKGIRYAKDYILHKKIKNILVNN